jgi:hypothetical protein
MLVHFLTLWVSAADMPAARQVSCVGRALERHADAPEVHVADGSTRREDRAASRRGHAPAAPPAVRFAFTPRLRADARYTPPALALRERAATRSSQRDPPDSHA